MVNLYARSVAWIKPLTSLKEASEMLKSDAPAILKTGMVEVDETFVGGKEKNKYASKRIKSITVITNNVSKQAEVVHRI